MSATELYPWLHPAFDYLDGLRRSDRVPGALLLQGREGLGLRHLALHFAARLLCLDSESASPCGRCQGCHLFDANTHPDMIVVEPEETGKMIKVDQVRKVIQDLSLMSLYHGYRVVIIDQADQMNQHAANALLKTLEESASKTLIMLMTHRPGSLLPTIRSRCQAVSIQMPSRHMAMEFLQGRVGGGEAEQLLIAANGSPLRALEIAQAQLLPVRDQRLAEFGGILRGDEDPLALAVSWAEQSPIETLDWVLSWLLDMVRLRLSDRIPKLLNEDHGKILEELARGLDVIELIHFRDAVVAYRAQLETSANRQLIFEAVLVRAQGLKAKAKAKDEVMDRGRSGAMAGLSSAGS